MIEVETLRRIDAALGDMSKDMRDVRERLIRIESNQLDRKVQSHADRIDALEKERDKREGATGIVAMILKTPLSAVVVLGAGAWGFLTGKVHL
jgi:hypothetical protein